MKTDYTVTERKLRKEIAKLESLVMFRPGIPRMKFTETLKNKIAVHLPGIEKAQMPVYRGRRILDFSVFKRFHADCSRAVDFLMHQALISEKKG